MAWAWHYDQKNQNNKRANQEKSILGKQRPPLPVKQSSFDTSWYIRHSQKSYTLKHCKKQKQRHKQKRHTITIYIKMNRIHEAIILFAILVICSSYVSGAPSSQYHSPDHNRNENITKNNLKSTSSSSTATATAIHQSSRKLKPNDDDDLEEEDDDNASSSSSNDNKKDSKTQRKQPTKYTSIENLESCKPISQCELCQGGHRGGHSGCSDTGRRIKMKCLSVSSSDPDSAEEVTLFTSCNRTAIDEEYLLVSTLVVVHVVVYRNRVMSL